MSNLLPDLSVTYESLILESVELSKEVKASLKRGEIPDDVSLFDCFKYICCTPLDNQFELVCELVRRGLIINLGWRVGENHTKSTYKLMSLLSTTTEQVSELVCFMHMDLLHARLIEWLETQPVEIVKCLLLARTRRMYGRVGNMLHWAFMEEQFELVREIFQRLKDLDEPEFSKTYINSKMSDGNSVLHVCLTLRRYRWVSYCLQHGCDIQVENELGLTPTHLAIRFDHVDTLKAFRIDPDVAILEYAIQHKAVKCVQHMLTEKNSLIENTYLMQMAMEKDDLDMVLCLLGQGMDVFDIEPAPCSPEIAWELLSRGMSPISTEMIVNAVETLNDVDIPHMTLLMHDLHLAMKSQNNGFLQRHTRLYTPNMFLLLKADEHTFTDKAKRWKDLITTKKL